MKKSILLALTIANKRKNIPKGYSWVNCPKPQLSPEVIRSLSPPKFKLYTLKTKTGPPLPANTKTPRAITKFWHRHKNSTFDVNIMSMADETVYAISESTRFKIGDIRKAPVHYVLGAYQKACNEQRAPEGFELSWVRGWRMKKITPREIRRCNFQPERGEWAKFTSQKARDTAAQLK